MYSRRGSVGQVDVVWVAWVAVTSLYGVRNELPHHESAGTLAERGVYGYDDKGYGRGGDCS